MAPKFQQSGSRDRKVFKRLYIQYVRPHLEYASAVWNPWLKGDIDLIEAVQKRAVKMMSGLEGKTYEERLEEIGLDSLETRRSKADLIQTFKIMKGIDRVDRRDIFKSYNDVATTRTTRLGEYGDNLIRRKISRSDIHNNFFCQRIINSWNQLPTRVKDSANVEIFKNQLNEYFTRTSIGGEEK